MESAILRRDALKKTRLVIVKVGTSSITDETLTLSERKIGKLVDELAALSSRGIHFIIVTSGAIGAGMGKLNLKQRPRDVNKLQAIAAIGQHELMKCYGKHFRKKGFEVAQILLTKDDFKNRSRYLNVRNTIQKLLDMGIVPIINENDSINVDEIRFGDNDTLSAMVASNLGADALILLSSVDGLYTRDPNRKKGARKISIVKKIDSDLESLHGKSRGGGVGGIQSKINAAKIVTKSGIAVLLVDSSMRNILTRALKGDDVGTIFLPIKKIDSRLHWVLFSSAPKGCITVDEGAFKALKEKGVSLLPSGVVAVSGTFKKGDTVCLLHKKKKEFARGITNYSSDEVEQIKGCHSSKIEKILGKKGYSDIIYSGNMVLL